MTCDECGERATSIEQARVVSLGPPLVLSVDIPAGWATAETEDGQTHVLCVGCVTEQAVQNVLERVATGCVVVLEDGTRASIRSAGADACVEARGGIRFKGASEAAARAFVSIVGVKSALALV